MERHAWFEPSMERLMELLKYPDKANEFASAKVTAVPVRSAVWLLSRYMGEHTPAPRIVPMKDGGILMEFLEYWVDIAIEIKPSGETKVTLGGDPEFFKIHAYEAETASGMFFEKVFSSGIDLLEVLRKKGPPDVSAKKSDDRGATQAPASAGS